LQGPEAILPVNYRSILSSDRAPHIKKPAVFNTGKNPVKSSRWESDTKIDWPIDLGRNFSFNFTELLVESNELTAQL
jgi:hypothetical protein